MLHNFLVQKNIQGFGLIELMVSVGIAVLVMSVVMVNHGSYNGAVLLRSQAYEVALEAREVQLTAVSVIGQGGDYRNVFGLYFDAERAPNYFRSFRDGASGSQANNYYDSSEDLGKRGNLDKRFEFGEIRLVSNLVETPVSEISIVFERPNFDARFYVPSGSGVPAEATSASAVEIDVRPVGSAGVGATNVRTIEITRTGQITVQ